MLRRPFISELLNTLVTEKFGNRTNDDDFSGPSDASEAPGNFLINFGGSNYVISPEIDSSSPVEPSPVSGDDRYRMTIRGDMLEYGPDWLLYMC